MHSVERTIAGILGLSAFGVACVSGLASGNDASTTVWRALGAMAVCVVVGWALGRAAKIVAAEHAQDHRERNPIPDAPEGAPEPGDQPDQPAHPGQPA